MSVKKGSTIFLKIVLVLIAAVALFAMIRFPQTEGRAANLDLVSIYIDPFIWYIYLASVPFFVALFQAFKLLGFVEKNKIFSKGAVSSVRTIKWCALSIIGFLVVAMAWVRFAVTGDDDPAGAMAMGIVLTFVSTVVATGSAIFEKLLHNATRLKSENDLTV